MREAAGWWVPDVILTKEDSFDFLHFFLPLISGYSTLSINPCRLVNDDGRCRRMGPGCQPHKTRSVWFLPLFLPLISRYSTLTFHICRPVNAEGRCRRMGPRCQPHNTRFSWHLDYFVPVILQATCLSFSIPSIKQRTRMWAPEVSLWVQEIIDILIIFHPWYSLLLSLPLNFLTA